MWKKISDHRLPSPVITDRSPPDGYHLFARIIIRALFNPFQPDLRVYAFEGQSGKLQVIENDVPIDGDRMNDMTYKRVIDLILILILSVA